MVINSKDTLLMHMQAVRVNVKVRLPYQLSWSIIQPLVLLKRTRNICTDSNRW